MSKPEPIEEPSLEESLAMVRRMLAEGAPQARSQADRGAETAGGKGGSQGAGAEPLAGARPPAPAQGAPMRGRLTDALRSVSTYPPEHEKRLGLGAVDDDLADLMDTGPQPGAETPPGGMVKDLSPMDLRGRARVAPSFDGDPRSLRSRPGASGAPVARLPSLDAGDGPVVPALPGPQGPAQRDALDAFKLPMGGSPASRLPSLDMTEPTDAASEPPAAMDAGGWPRGTVRNEPELPGLVSAPPSKPVVIAAMPSEGMAQPETPLVGAPPTKGSEVSRDAAVLPMPSVEAATAQERQEDSRFEVIAAMGPVVAVAKPEPVTGKTSAVAPEPGPDARIVGGDALPETSSGTTNGAIEVIGVASPAVPAEDGIANARPETPPETADVTGFSVTGPNDAAVVSAAVDEVATVLDRLVAGLSAGSASRLDLSKPLTEAFPAVGDEAAFAASASEPGTAATAAESVVSSAEAFIAGVHAPHEISLTGIPPSETPDVEPVEGLELPGADAMLKLVGTSVAIGHEGAIVAAGEAFDDTVSELLRPMLRKWLESNMPRIVEKALRKELAELQADIQKAAEDDK